LLEPSSTILDPSAPVLKIAAPVMVRVPLSVISPVVAVPLKVPPMVDAAKVSAASLTIVTAPDPLGARVKDPSTAIVPRLITPALASVVADRLPPTVTVPLSVIPEALPLVKSPSIVDAAMMRAVVPPSIVTSASVPDESLVVIVKAPVKALVVTSRTIVPLSALVTSVVVPVIARAPLSVIFPLVAVAVRAPPTVDAAKVNAASLTMVAAPVLLVVSAMVPSTAIVPRLITPALASVVADRLPPTVTVPLSVIPEALPLVRVKSPSIVMPQ